MIIGIYGLAEVGFGIEKSIFLHLMLLCDYHWIMPHTPPNSFRLDIFLCKVIF